MILVSVICYQQLSQSASCASKLADYNLLKATWAICTSYVSVGVGDRWMQMVSW